MAKQNKPAIRFKGFTDAWEQRKLGEMGQTYTGLSGKTKDDFGHGRARFVTYMNVFSNPISNPEMTEPIEIDPKQNEVEVGDVFFTTSSETPEEVGMSSILLEKRGKTYLNSFCFGFRPSEKIDSYYLAYMLRSESARAKITLLAQGISRYNISKNKVMEIAVSLPSLDEQKMIGQYFSQLDHLITLHQRKYDKLQVLKKAMLEKMFPKNGSSVPEIRFKGFTDAWEQRKLGDFCEMFNGDRSAKYPNEQDMVHEGIPFINAGDLENGCVNLLNANKITTEKYNDLGGAKLQLGDIVYCLRGTLGKNAYIDNFSEGTVASSLVAIRPKNIDGKYLFYILNSDIEYSQRILHDEGAAQPNLSAKSVSEFIIPIPNIDEQKKLSSFFDSLSNLITLHQRELEKLQNIKKSMLEKMFV